MKRVKIMLTAITVFAVVGGALAFKAQKYSLQKVCIGTEENVCPALVQRSTFTDSGTPFYYTTTQGTNCQGAICTSSTSLIKEN